MRLECTLGAAIAAIAAAAASAAPIPFDPGDYDDNTSTQTTGSFRDAQNNDRIARDASNNWLTFTGVTATISAATLYDTTVADGTATTNTFLNTAVTVDFRLNEASNSFGPFTRLANDGTGGYLTLIQANTSGSTDTLRFFENANANDGTLTQIGSNITASVIDEDTWYTMVFSVTNNGGGGAVLDTKIYAQGDVAGTPLWSQSVTDTTSPKLTAGQVGLRFGDNNATLVRTNNVDNFDVAEVPEPASIVAVGAFTTGLLLRRRRDSRR